MSPELHQGLPEKNEKQLCVSCMAPNDPAAHFCIECGAPLSSFASTGPFEHLFAEGAVYRQASERPQKLVVVFGIWLIFGTMAVAGIIFLGFALQGAVLPRILMTLLGLGLITVSCTMIWKTTRNYLARKRMDERTEA